MKSIELDDLTFQRLTVFAEIEKVSIPEAVKILVDLQQIPAVKPGPGYREHLLEVLRIAKEEGDEAAERFMKENPYVEADHG